MNRHSNGCNNSRRMNTTQGGNKVAGWAGRRALFMANSRSVCLQLLNWLLWLVQMPPCVREAWICISHDRIAKTLISGQEIHLR